MATFNTIKINTILCLLICIWITAEGATTYLNNPVSENAVPQQVYSSLPQNYYVPQTLQKYVAANPKYVAPTGNEIPVVIPKPITSTEKAILSPSYKLAYDAGKYVVSQTVKPTPVAYAGSPGTIPYVYTVPKVLPTPPTSYNSIANIQSSYDEEIPKKYQYGYRVSDGYSGAEFGHSEVNDGNTAKGYYHVLLPDGRLQSVKYYAGPSGYHATITYETKY